MRIEIELLHENPLNATIYGQDEPDQLTELIEKIRVPEYIKPLIINPGFILRNWLWRFLSFKDGGSDIRTV
jgi:hypothetical protein